MNNDIKITFQIVLNTSKVHCFDKIQPQVPHCFLKYIYIKTNKQTMNLLINRLSNLQITKLAFRLLELTVFEHPSCISFIEVSILAAVGLSTLVC